MKRLPSLIVIIVLVLTALLVFVNRTISSPPEIPESPLQGQVLISPVPMQ